MTSAIRANLLARKRKKLAEGDKRPLRGDDPTKVICWECRAELKNGRRVVSRAFGKNDRIQYHYKCARLLKII